MTNVQIKFQMNGRESAIAADCTVVEAQTNYLVFKADGLVANSVPYGCIEKLKINDFEVTDFSQEGISKVLLEETDEGSSAADDSSAAVQEPATPAVTPEQPGGEG